MVISNLWCSNTTTHCYTLWVMERWCSLILALSSFLSSLVFSCLHLFLVFSYDCLALSCLLLFSLVFSCLLSSFFLSSLVSGFLLLPCSVLSSPTFHCLLLSCLLLSSLVFFFFVSGVLLPFSFSVFPCLLLSTFVFPCFWCSSTLAFVVFPCFLYALPSFIFSLPTFIAFFKFFIPSFSRSSLLIFLLFSLLLSFNLFCFLFHFPFLSLSFLYWFASRRLYNSLQIFLLSFFIYCLLSSSFIVLCAFVHICLSFISSSHLPFFLSFSLFS